MAERRASTPRPSAPSTWPSATSGWSPGAPTSATWRATSTSPGTATTRSRPRTERAPVTDDVDVVIVGGGIAGLARRRPAAQGRHRADPHPRPGRRLRRHLVLEPLPGRDVRRRVVHVHADARGARLRPDAPGTRSARRSGSTWRRSPTTSTSRSDALFHTGVTEAEWDEDGRALADPHRPRRRDHVPLLRARRRAPQPAEAARPSPAWRTSPGRRSTPRAGTTRSPAARPGEPPHQARRQGRRAHRHRRHRHPVPAAAGGGGQARRRVPAHAVGHRRARQPTHRSRSSPPALEPGWQQARMDNFQAIMLGRQARRGPRRRRVDAALRGRPPPAQGGHPRGVHAGRRGARLRDHGGAPAAGRGAGGGSRHGRDPQAALPVPVQAPVLPRRVPERVQQRRTSPSSTAPPASTR